MDDPNKTQSRGAGSSFTGQQSTADSAAPQQPVAPISGPHKEVAPLSGQRAELPQPTEAAPELSKEVEAAGVEKTPEDKPEIAPEAAQLGLTHAKEHVPHVTEPTGVVSLPPITQQQAVVMKKNASVRDAARWLAVFILRQFDKIAYQKLPTK